MKRTVWVLVAGLVLAACGGGAATSTTAGPVDVGDLDLSGLHFEVHQAPG